MLPVAGRPLVDYTYDKLAEVAEIDEVHLVTNARFAGDFARWADGLTGRLPVQVHDDGTQSNDDRLGAIGDIQLTVERGGLGEDDLLVAAGDNLFEFALPEYVAFWRSKGAASAVAAHECRERELVSQYSIVELDSDERVVGFVEKPAEPTSNLIGIAIYLYHRDHVPLIRRYLDEGNSPDQPGNLVAWLHTRASVYGFRFGGEWLDIGNHEQLLDADNRMRARQGLPQRAAYSLS